MKKMNLRYLIVFVSAICAGRSAMSATFIVTMVNTVFTPPNLTINVGDTVTWRCDQGFHDTVSGVNGQPSGFWNSNVQFPALMRPGNMFSVTFNNAGTFPYYCTPHWPLGMVGSITVQSVNSAPTISIINPPDQSNFNAPADITVEASAFDADGDPLTVEFFMNGTSLGTDSTPPYQMPVNGLGPGNYTFTATARDPAGLTASASSSITVNGLQPAIGVGPQSQIVNAGSDVTLSVQANGTPPLNYQWFFGADLIGGAIGPSLMLTNVSPADSGSYTVQVSNGFGSTFASATLTVTSPPSGTAPTFSSEPRSQTVNAGTNVTFTAEAIGSLPLSWRWFFNNEPIPDATNASFTLLNVGPGNTGQYFVSVNNPFGSATSSNATLTVVTCDLTLSKLSSSFPPEGGTDSVDVIGPAGCAWTVQNSNAWVQITSASSGSGPATVRFTVASNATHIARSGILVIAGNLFTVSQTATLFPAKNDFNHDGQTDFVFQNTDGRVNVWLMDGTTRTGIAPLRNGRPAAFGSRIVGTQDFDLDGNVDILWQRGDGALQIWFMNGTNFLRSELIAPAPALGNAWQVIGLGDFNRDLHPDILLRHTEGYLLLWYMKGKQYLRQTLLYNGQAIPIAWRVVGVADMNNDGYADIIWQKPSSAIVVWFMNKETPVRGPLLSNLPRIDAAIVGLNDLNQDGAVDFVWRHSDGHLSTWWMNNTNRLGSFPINGREIVPPAWKFAAPKN